ncbi:MAG: glycosyltransferase [Candidatus Berkelbacteria bacterium]|nr:glycosyltransferase [Candidatus Berkelbacteria bacterium]
MRIKTTVVIPTYKRPKELKGCLRSVLDQTLKPDEVIVVDDNPQSDLEKVISKYKGVKYLKNPANLGLVLNKNRAALEASGEFIANVDDDMVLESDYLEKTVAVFSDKSVGAASGQLIEKPQYKKFNFYFFLLRLPFFFFKKNRIGKIWGVGEVSSGFEGNKKIDCDWLGGGALLVRKDIFIQVGGRDPAFVGSGEFEETDLTHRIKKEGFKLVYEPAAVAHHPRSSKRKNQYHFNFSSNEVYFYLKNLIPKAVLEKTGFVFYHFFWQILVNLVFSIFNPRHFLQIIGKFSGLIRAGRRRKPKNLKSGVSILTGSEGYIAQSIEKINRYYVNGLVEKGIRVKKLSQGKLRFPFYNAQIARYFFYPRKAKRSKTLFNHISGEGDAHLLCYLPESSIKLINCYDLYSKETRPWELINLALEGFSKRVLKRADFVFTSSQETKKSLIRFGINGEKVIVNWLGYDNKVFRPLPKKISRNILGLPQSKKILLHVGTEHQRKNIKVLFESLREINKSGEYLLVRVGESKNGDLIEKLGMGGSVKYFNNVQEEILGYLYSAADLLVFPSLCEGFGMPIIEAFASGLPVACSDIPVFREIAGGAALFFKPTTQGLKRSLAVFFKSGRVASRLRRQGLKRAGNFSWDKFVYRYVDFFRILSRSSGLSKLDDSR